jgi:hypothetical protein
VATRTSKFFSALGSSDSEEANALKNLLVQVATVCFFQENWTASCFFIFSDQDPRSTGPIFSAFCALDLDAQNALKIGPVERGYCFLGRKKNPI